MSACVSVQVHWKKAICSLINLGYSEATVQNCDEAQEDIEYLIECIKKLAQERESMIEELETVNIKVEILRNAVPNLTKQHEMEQVRVLSKSEWNNNKKVYKKFCKIQRLNSLNKDSQVETQRLLDEQSDLEESSRNLNQQWDVVSASVSALIMKRVKSKLTVRDTTKFKDHLNKEMTELARENVEKQATASERKEDKIKRRRQVEREVDAWQERIDEQFVRTNTAHEKYQCHQDNLFDINAKLDRCEQIHDSTIYAINSKTLKIEQQQAHVNVLTEEVGKLDVKSAAAAREYARLIKYFQDRVKYKTMDNKKMEGMIMNGHYEHKLLKEKWGKYQKEAKETEQTLLDIQSIQKVRISSYQSSLKRAQWMDDEEKMRYNAKDQIEDKSKTVKEEHEKIVNIWKISLAKNAEELNWESLARDKVQEEVEDTQADLEDFQEEVEVFHEEVVEKLEDHKVERKESLKEYKSLLELTERMTNATVSLEADIPMRRKDLEHKKVQLREEVQNIEEHVQTLAETVEIVLEEVAIERPYLEELRKSLDTEELVRNDSLCKLKECEIFHFELLEYWGRYRKNLEDADSRVRTMKSEVEDMNKRVLALDQKHYEELHASGERLSELLRIEDALLEENTVFVDSINQEADKIKGLVKTFVRLIRIVTLKPQQIRILQQLLAKLAGHARDIGSDVNADMEESLQMMRSLEQTVLNSIDRVDNTVEGLTSKIDQFEQIEDKTLKAYLNDLAASKLSLATSRSECERMSVNQVSELLFPSAAATAGKKPLPPINQKTTSSSKTNKGKTATRFEASSKRIIASKS